MNDDQMIELTNLIYAELGLPAVTSEAESEALRDTLTTEQLIVIASIESAIATRLEWYAGYRSLSFGQMQTIVGTIAHTIAHKYFTKVKIP